jgi:phage tail protein X
MNDKDLRDCFAMFAMMGIVSRGIDGDMVDKVCHNAYVMADAMLEARNKDNEEVELGIAAFKPKKRSIKKDNGGRSI